MSEEVTLNTVDLAAELTIAWLGNQNNRVAPDDVPVFLRAMHQAINDLSGTGAAASDAAEAQDAESEFTAAVSVRKSLASKDHILSMIDGKPYRTLRRHLSTHGMTPDEYRARYKLKRDYPMVAPSYSEARRATAKKIGLGRKGAQVGEGATAKAETAAPAPAPAPVRRSRKKSANT
jgi:predicted transcriptional regulator